MFNQNKITKILGATFILVSSNSAFAATISTPATVTVKNTFTFVKDADLVFGTIRAKQDASGGTNIATLVISSDPAVTTPTVTTAGTAAITSLIDGTPAEFSITGAASFTPISITMPAAFNLTYGSAPPNSPVFKVSTPTAHVTSGSNAGLAYNTSVSNLLTDVSGAVSFALGATLTTDTATTTTSQYQDAAYIGSFNVIVDY